MDTEVKQYSIGSLFAGIGGFELGLERAIPEAYTLWQVEQNTFCQKVLAKHWPEARIYDDVRNITKNNVEQVDILCGGFPCQDISLAGKGEGLHGKKSGLWWEMHRIIEELQPKAVIMENVAAINIRGLGTVLGSLSEIGYDAEWCTIRASDFGAPHHRARWFCIAYPHSIRSPQAWNRRTTQKISKGNEVQPRRSQDASTNPHSSYAQRKRISSGIHEKNSNNCSNIQTRSFWKRPCESEPTICRVDDGIRSRLDKNHVNNINNRLQALGNAIVPQCSEWIGKKLWESGILQAQDKNL